MKMIRFLQEHPEGATSKEIAEAMKTTIRTVQNYLKELRIDPVENFEIIPLEKGRYKLKNNSLELAKKGCEQEEKIFLKLAIKHLEDLEKISKAQDDLLEELNLKNLKTPFFLKSESYEEIDIDDEEVKKLQEAIDNDNAIAFSFEGKEFYVEPYRLVNFDGLWYLYGKDREEKEENPFKTWRLDDIDEVEIFYNDTHSMDDEEIEEDLENAPSAHFIPDREIPIILEVDKKIQDIFLAKEYFWKQELIKESKEHFICKAYASTYLDIEKDIKYWLPFIRILEPKEFQERLEEELRRYLSC